MVYDDRSNFDKNQSQSWIKNLKYLVSLQKLKMYDAHPILTIKANA